MTTKDETWIYSRRFDCAFILAPAIVVSLLMLLLPASTTSSVRALPMWVWALCVMGVDVSHVYSTLYRTYFDPEERQRYSSLLWGIPLICWVVGVLLYSQSAALFWTVLAYVAVYHFIRQQYGFTMIYARKEPMGWSKFLDRSFAYAGPLYPLLYWHAHLPREFHWFVDGDFVVPVSTSLVSVASVCYVLLILLYLCKEVWIWAAAGTLNIPKNLFLCGSAASWYVGIVSFNADLPFTVTNVVSHGVPYMGLIWAFGAKKWQRRSVSSATALIAALHRGKWLPIFLGLLGLLAYVEEGIWDRLVWREHPQLFSAFNFLPDLSGATILALLVPLLAVPQATHYVLDAFIWRVRTPDPGFELLLEKRGS